MKAYLAGPIFTYGYLLRNTEWAKKIRDAFPDIDLYSPVENTDILIACIDGDTIPAGTSAEIGKFHEKIARGDDKFIVGICTDNRQCHLTHSEAKDNGGAASLGEQQYSYQNLYVTGLIKEYGVLVSNIEDAIKEIQKWLDPRPSIEEIERFWRESE